ncbi:2Fe-2S iron-sulfur cluster-binding protein [Paraburkholderia tagetis]|uniref:nitric oxide dioxygenase n=1 Tax=Paraburkholderia tagetis TaxID=2913261 RepID=A0A9X1RUW7_9BURK|nr:2Fe-2S iron-sulfur cluster-binding protein [Paraburkholderia tagetis]MCG5075394.1 2Fe-2S iron-sulfur cluster-binding protein [Paraburkholderia tagetis]
MSDVVNREAGVLELPGRAPTGFRRLRVNARTRESASIVSFELVPADGEALPPFVAGQFATLRLPLPSGERLLRTYSLSGDPADAARWRISVKREPAPAGREDLAAGRGSSYLHDAVQVGDELEVAGPSGAFVCGDDTTRPVVLMSGGVGLTPLVSMLHRLRTMEGAQDRRVYFIHGCENGAVHAFGREVAAVAAECVHICYRQPSAHDRLARAFDSEGLIARETLQGLLPLDDYEVYLCGPPAFMQANWRLLRGLGVARERIHYEFFGPATVLEADADQEPAREAPSEPTESDKAEREIDAHATTVRFHHHATPVAWDARCESLLELAEQHGYAVPFSCRVGICNTCVTPLAEGQVEYATAPLDPPPEGAVVLCCAKPLGNVTLALSDVPAHAFKAAV